MAKKKQTAQSKIANSKWYIKLGLLIILLIACFQLFKFMMNTYNISLLNKAETKMKALKLPKSDYTEYNRSCSFRSVKFSGAGSPNCDVIRRDTFFNTNEYQAYRIGEAYQKEILKNYQAQSVGFKDKDSFAQGFSGIESERNSIQGISLQNGLICYTVFGIKTPEVLNFILKNPPRVDSSSNLLVTTSCYRRFMFQTYPER